MTFSGFQSGAGPGYPLPSQFFSELLPLIDDLDELRLTLYIFWRLHQMEGNFRYLLRDHIAAEASWLYAEPAAALDPPERLDAAIDRAVSTGTILLIDVQEAGQPQQLIFLNTPRGRAAAAGLQRGDWQLQDLPDLPAEVVQDRPGVFQLYESHIGPLTPMLAEALRDAEQTYPAEWIEDAIRIAVENNVRRWRYVEAILKSWQEQGRDERRDQRDAETDRQKYVKGEFARFIEH